ncbi:MAG: hypothetical protein ACOYVD_19100 [Bacillota bacterium]
MFKGYIISRIIVKTGKKHGPLKGAGMGFLYWLTNIGKDTNLFKELISGSLSGLFVKKCGNEELFPYELPEPKKNNNFKFKNIKRRFR